MDFELGIGLRDKVALITGAGARCDGIGNGPDHLLTFTFDCDIRG